MKDQLMLLIIALVQHKNSITLIKANTKFCLGLHYDSDQSYLYVNKKEICKFRSKDNLSWYNFCLGDISKDLTKDEQSDMSLNRVCLIFQLIIVQLKRGHS